MNAIPPLGKNCRGNPRRTSEGMDKCFSLLALSDNIRQKHHAADSIIYLSGDQPDYLMIISSGLTSSSATLEDGRTQILSLHFKGDILGYSSNRPIPYEMVALTDVSLQYIRREDFNHYMGSNSDFRDTFINSLISTLDQTRSWMVALGRKTARERLATLILFLIKKGQSARAVVRGNRAHLTLPLSRVEIGNILALTVHTVSRTFTALRNDEVIKVNGRNLVVPDLSRLFSETGDNTAPRLPQNYLPR